MIVGLEKEYKEKALQLFQKAGFKFDTVYELTHDIKAQHISYYDKNTDIVEQPAESIILLKGTKFIFRERFFKRLSIKGLDDPIFEREIWLVIADGLDNYFIRYAYTEYNDHTSALQLKDMIKEISPIKDMLPYEELEKLKAEKICARKSYERRTNVISVLKLISLVGVLIWGALRTILIKPSLIVVLGLLIEGVVLFLLMAYQYFKLDNECYKTDRAYEDKINALITKTTVKGQLFLANKENFKDTDYDYYNRELSYDYAVISDETVESITDDNDMNVGENELYG